MRRAAELRSSGGVGPAEPKFKRAKRSRVATWPGGADFLLLCTSAERRWERPSEIRPGNSEVWGTSDVAGSEVQPDRSEGRSGAGNGELGCTFPSGASAGWDPVGLRLRPSPRLFLKRCRAALRTVRPQPKSKVTRCTGLMRLEWNATARANWGSPSAPAARPGAQNRSQWWKWWAPEPDPWGLVRVGRPRETALALSETEGQTNRLPTAGAERFLPVHIFLF